MKRGFLKLTTVFAAGLALAILLSAVVLPATTKEEAEVDTLISDCRAGWHCDGGAKFSSFAEGTDGNAAARADFTTQFFFFYVGGTAFDLTGAKYIEMDLYVTDTMMFRNATDCRMDIGPDANVDNWNVKLPGSVFRGLELSEGWNHVVLPISGIENPNYDLKTARIIRFYAIGLGDTSRTCMIDNLHAVSEAPDDGFPEEPERVVKYKKYTFSATANRQPDDAIVPLQVFKDR